MNIYVGLACADWQFRCVESGDCIDLSQRCDGQYDCSDTSDETFCAEENTREPDYYGSVDTNSTDYR